MIFDELVLIFLTHALQGIEFTLEITGEGIACLDNFIHNIETLGLANTWTEWVVCHVSSNSNSSRIYHSFLFWGEVSVRESFSVHV